MSGNDGQNAPKIHFWKIPSKICRQFRPQNPKLHSRFSRIDLDPET